MTSALCGEKLDAAIAMRDRGLSTAKIASEVGVTKNVVVGYFYRHGIGTAHPRKAAASPAPPPITLIDAGGCRWIEGEPTPLRSGMYCSRPVVIRKHPDGESHRTSYCAEHFPRTVNAKATGSAKQRAEESRVRASLRMLDRTDRGHINL